MSDVEAVRSTCERLRSKTDALRGRAWRDVVDTLGAVGARFLDSADTLRQEALERLPAEAGLSSPMAEVVLDGMARDWTADRLHSMVAAELEEPDCLDGVHRIGGRRLVAVGPALCLQVVAGSVPGVGVHALIRSLVCKAPTLLKPGRGDTLLPVLFARGLADADPDLGKALEVLYWPGGASGPLVEALGSADVAVVYGSDETVAAVRSAARPTTRIVEYHHRVGLAVIGRSATVPGSIEAAAAALARAVAVFEQRGCVCPHLVYVEGGPDEAARFAETLAVVFEALEEVLPSAPLSAEEGAALQQLRGTAELAAASGAGSVRHGGSGTWTVIVEGGSVGGPPTFARGVRVRSIADVAELAGKVEALGPHLQTVGYAGLGARLAPVAEALARAGASRIVPLQRMSFPPPWWLHDGRGPLRVLLRWAEVEAG
jgi:hypothetical protein